MTKGPKSALWFAVGALGLILASGAAMAAEPPLRFQIPATVSPEAYKELTDLYALIAKFPPEPKPTTIEDWDRLRESADRFMLPASDAIVARTGSTVRDDRIGGVPVVRLLPANYKPSGRTLIYLHGGGYTRFSAHSRLGPAALVAAATGDEVISIDYTVAPRGNFRTVTDEVVSVWKGLLTQGLKPGRIGIFGDSAGGGIASASTLKIRDQGLPLPGALYLMSPAADLTRQGDSYLTMSKIDPILNPDSVAWGEDAYAAPQDRKNPYASPVYGDYSKAFPPTLIQGGTREMILSGFVRQYQAIRSGGHDVVLDLYDGMPHVFQDSIPNAPETRTAFARAAQFLHQHLR